MHRGTTIESVTLYLPHSVKEDVIVLSTWMHNWSWKGIHELDIGLNSRDFSLPLFQCRNLRSLRLSLGALNLPPDCHGYFYLVTLNLFDVAMSSLSLGTLISRSKQLKGLYFYGELSASSTIDHFLLLMRLI